MRMDVKTIARFLPPAFPTRSKDQSRRTPTDTRDHPRPRLHRRTIQPVPHPVRRLSCRPLRLPQPVRRRTLFLIGDAVRRPAQSAVGGRAKPALFQRHAGGHRACHAIRVSRRSRIRRRAIRQTRPLIANPPLPYVGLMLFAHLRLPPAPFGSLAARGRADPAGDWVMPRPVFVALIIVLCLSYSYSGYTKLLSPNRVSGDAVALVLQNPRARDWFLRDVLLALPEWVTTSSNGSRIEQSSLARHGLRKRRKQRSTSSLGPAVAAGAIDFSAKGWRALSNPEIRPNTAAPVRRGLRGGPALGQAAASPSGAFSRGSFPPAGWPRRRDKPAPKSQVGSGSAGSGSQRPAMPIRWSASRQFRASRCAWTRRRLTGSLRQPRALAGRTLP